MTEDVLFGREVDRWVVETIGEGRIDFGGLVRALPGVDPSLVRKRLEALDKELRGRVDWHAVDQPVNVIDRRLPVPHPLDFDWRFSPSTVSQLADELVVHPGRLTLLGTPSLWMALRGRVRADLLRLLDANPSLKTDSVCPGATVLVVDVLKDDLPSLSSDVVLADPPWYPEAIAGFLWAGSWLLRLGGALMLSMPPSGTRPGVRRECEELLGFAPSCGLTLRSKRPGALRYSSPPFERAALRAAGLAQHVPNDWRQGDLLVFERTSDVVAPRPTAQQRRWTERTVSGVRIQIDDYATPTNDDPQLISLVSNDVLPSVSRRDKRRSNVRVWTSGNRVFGCGSPSRLVGIIDDIIAGRSLADPVDRRVAESVLVLVERERGEYICSDDRDRVVRPAT